MSSTTATAAVASSFFSTSIHTLAPKTWPNDHLIKILSTRILQPISLSCSFGIDQSNQHIGCCRRFSRLAAAVAEEETAVTDEVVAEEEVVEAAADAGNTKLYFGNLPYNCDSAQLAGIIQEYASPELVEVLYDRNTGRSRGFAFVTMSSVEECEKVIENLDGRDFGGRSLRVNLSDKPKPKDPLYPETEYKLFVGNLSWSVTSEILTETFQEYGSVIGARVLYDGETGKSRGYGFVCYETKEEMDAALEALNGVELEGRTLRVSMAQGKKQ